MDVLPPRFDLVVVPFASSANEIQLIHQAEFLEQFYGAANRGAINAWLTLARAVDQCDGVAMLVGFLNDFNRRAALGRRPNAF